MDREARRAERRVAKAAHRLIERQKAGEPPATLAETLAVCPFRTVLGPPDVTSETPTDGVHALLGYGPEDFTDAVRDDIVNDYLAGRIMLIISNRADLRDHAKREISRAIDAAVLGPGMLWPN